MRTGLLAFGILLLILGGVFYLYPVASTTATKTAVGDAPSSRTIQAAAIVPIQLILILLAAGFIFTLLGLIIPSDTKVEDVEKLHEHDHVKGHNHEKLAHGRSHEKEEVYERKTIHRH